MNEIRLRGKQRGISLISVIIAGIVLIFIMVIAFRSVPVITEYIAVKRAIQRVASNAEPSTSPYDVASAFDRYAEIDQISSVKGSDLVVSRENNRLVIAVAYERTVPLFANVSLLYDFNTSSRDVK